MSSHTTHHLWSETRLVAIRADNKKTLAGVGVVRLFAGPDCTVILTPAQATDVVNALSAALLDVPSASAV